MPDELSPAEQDAVEELRAQYHVGVPAALFILRAHQLYVHKANEVRKFLQEEGCLSKTASDAIELENVVACFHDVTEGIANKISNACEALRSQYSHLKVPDQSIIAAALVRENYVSVFLQEYARTKAELVAEMSSEMPPEGAVLEEKDVGGEETDGESHVVTGEDELERDCTKAESLGAAFSKYEDDHQVVLEELMAVFPSFLKDDVFYDIGALIERKIDDFAFGKYVHGLEHHLLAQLEHRDAPFYDDLYVRLKLEQKTDDAALQRIYLARFVAQHRVTTMVELGGVISDGCFFYRNEPEKKKTPEGRLTKEKLQFVKKCVKTHLAWLERFLKN